MRLFVFVRSDAREVMFTIERNRDGANREEGS